MNIFLKVARATSLFRLEFGTLRGNWLWLALLQEKFPASRRVFTVRVLGVPAKLHLRAKTSDADCLCQIFLHRELAVGLLHPIDHIIDAGANIGLASVHFANRYPVALRLHRPAMNRQEVVSRTKKLGDGCDAANAAVRAIPVVMMLPTAHVI